METGMNTLQNGHKICNFTLTLTSVVAMVPAVLDESSRRFPAVHLIELVVCNFFRKSSNVYLFNFC